MDSNDLRKDASMTHIEMEEVQMHLPGMAPSWYTEAIKNNQTVPTMYWPKTGAVDVAASLKQVGGDHYKTMGIQPSDFIDSNKLGWYEGNAVKYICRHKVKGGKEDLLKAIHYLELALEKHYAK